MTTNEVLELIKAAHTAAGECDDPRKNKILGHLNQAIGVLDPAAAGTARAATTPTNRTAPGRFGSTPPPVNQPLANINKYDLPKKDAAPAVSNDGEQGLAGKDNTQAEILEAKANAGVLVEHSGSLADDLAAMTPQQIAEKYNLEQLQNIADSFGVEVGERASAKQIAAAIKAAIKAAK